MTFGWPTSPDDGWGYGGNYYEKAWDSDDAIEAQVGKVGEICEIKDTFAKLNISGDFVKWLDQKPYGEEEDEVRKAKRVRDTYAVVCGRFPTKESTWEVHTIWINNDILKAALREALKGRGDVIFNSDILEFKKPFLPLIHRWEQLCELAVDDTGSETQKLMNLFVEMLKHELRDTLGRVKKVKETRCASFDDLEFVFKPGQLFFRSQPQMAAGILSHYNHRGTMYVSQMNWVGSGYCMNTSKWHVTPFDGVRPLSKLNVRPDWACSKNEIKAMKTALIKRGRKYEGLRGIHLRFHIGSVEVVPKNDLGCWAPAEVPETQVQNVGWGDEISTNTPQASRHSIEVTEGQVVVDDGYDQPESDSGGVWGPSPLSSQKTKSAKEADENGTDSSVVCNRQEAQGSSIEKDEDERDAAIRLTDQQAMMTVSSVRCFSLEKKVWCQIEVDDLIDIEWNTKAFDNLVLDEGEKRLLVGFVSATKKDRLRQFDDFVQGKGKGLILLLCGPPGTGKTLTAESVSENLKRPLYRVDASDLGVDSKQLEKSLRTALDRCVRWDAILLLDEADVFLEKRSSNNLLQNEMTTVFLRLLEYYKGVMILTTNRYPAIDPAFESRIDISLIFPNLDPASRAKIWYNFLVREDTKLAKDRSAIAELAKTPLNGRQIKSAIKTGRILATSENLPLAMDHLQTVVAMRKKALRMLGQDTFENSDGDLRDEGPVSSSLLTWASDSSASTDGM